MPSHLRVPSKLAGGICSLGKAQWLSKFGHRALSTWCAPRNPLLPSSELVRRSPSSVLNKFVTYPVEDFDRYLSPFLKEELLEQLTAFNDYALLLRSPSISIIRDLLQIRSLQTSPVPIETDVISQSVPRFVLYGQPGTGISANLAQIGYFAAKNDWLVLPFPNAEEWTYRCYDMTPSGEYHQAQHRPHLVGEAFDFPERSAKWLTGFLKYNAPFLEKHNPVITRNVEWTSVDTAAAGTPWTDLINFAIVRPKYSTDCIGILLREMRSLCSQPNGPPCLLLVDGINFIWCRATRLKDKTLQRRVTVDRLAIVHHMTRALRADWHHGAIVTSVSIKAAWPTDREKYTPGYLLGKAGFECLDPFVPIHVENYSKAELDACMQFYLENKWLSNPAAQTEEGRAELEFLSDRNPLELDRLAAEW